jgi:hypothetical protein
VKPQAEEAGLTDDACRSMPKMARYHVQSGIPRSVVLTSPGCVMPVVRVGFMPGFHVQHGSPSSCHGPGKWPALVIGRLIAPWHTRSCLSVCGTVAVRVGPAQRVGPSTARRGERETCIQKVLVSDTRGYPTPVQTAPGRLRAFTERVPCAGPLTGNVTDARGTRNVSSVGYCGLVRAIRRCNGKQLEQDSPPNGFPSHPDRRKRRNGSNSSTCQTLVRSQVHSTAGSN